MTPDMPAEGHCITFTPFFMVYVDPKTGACTGRWDWSDSCQGEHTDFPGLDQGDSTPLAEVVCHMLDVLTVDGMAWGAHDGRDLSNPVDLGQLPTRYVLTVDGKGWGGHVAATREEIEAKIAEYRKTFPNTNFQIAEVSVPLDPPQGGDE